jgi:hypothetical protein
MLVSIWEFYENQLRKGLKFPDERKCMYCEIVWYFETDIAMVYSVDHVTEYSL